MLQPLAKSAVPIRHQTAAWTDLKRRAEPVKHPVKQRLAVLLTILTHLQRLGVAPAALDQQRGGHGVRAHDVRHQPRHLLVSFTLAQ
jgi:hypothetical protein